MSAATDARASEPTQAGLFEIRFYTAVEGKRDELAEYMDEVVIPFNREHGVDVVASFIDEQNDDGYIWIRRFDHEAARAAQYPAVYESARWNDEIAPRVMTLMHRERAVVTRAVPTAGSRIR